MEKERLEDIDVMEGIDFKANQIRYREAQKKAEKIRLIQLIILTTILVVLILLTNCNF